MKHHTNNTDVGSITGSMFIIGFIASICICFSQCGNGCTDATKGIASIFQYFGIFVAVLIGIGIIIAGIFVIRFLVKAIKNKQKNTSKSSTKQKKSKPTYKQLMSKYQQANDIIQQQNGQIEALSTTNTTLNQKLLLDIQKLQQQSTEITHLQQKLASTSVQVARLQNAANNTHNASDYDALMQSYKDKVIETGNLKKQNDALTTKCSEYKTVTQQQKTEIKTLQQQLQKLSQQLSQAQSTNRYMQSSSHENIEKTRNTHNTVLPTHINRSHIQPASSQYNATAHPTLTQFPQNIINNIFAVHITFPTTGIATPYYLAVYDTLDQLLTKIITIEDTHEMTRKIHVTLSRTPSANNGYIIIALDKNATQYVEKYPITFNLSFDTDF